jgi:hypothetical protein
MDALRRSVGGGEAPARKGKRSNGKARGGRRSAA